MTDLETAIAAVQQRAQVLTSVEAENAMLRTQVAGYRADIERELKAHEVTIGTVYALRKDAERYRWLRDSAGNDIMEKLMAECSPPRWDELVDAAIDAAMGERP